MSNGTVQKTSYDLGGRKVAIIATDGFEASELLEPLRGVGADFDALVIPGGVMNPDKLRMNDEVVAFAPCSRLFGRE